MSFQIPAPTTTTASTGFSFGLPTPATNVAKPTTTGFSFGSSGGGDAGIAAKPLGFGLGTTPATTAPTAGTALGQRSSTFGLGAATTAATTTATTAASTTATSNFSFGAPTASTAATSTANATTTAATFSLPKPAPVTGAGTLGLTAASTTQPAAAAAPTTAPPGFASLSTTTKTTDSASVATATQVSYNQLEEHINKWTLELEEQEKMFTDQATQINAWDKILISNNQKILELNEAVQRVKTDQQTLEQELEFIATQHHELEESIVPLQKEFMQIPQVDMERSQTYLMVENLDTQLKQMSEDLKEIIENLNEANKGQDNNDPIIQIGKILNAHMSSLQWIESSSANISNKLEDINKMHEDFKRESERSFRSAYYK